MGNTKFRIGDTVKVVGVCDHRSSYNGVVFVIRSINPNGVYGATKEHYGVHSDDVHCSYVFYVDELELIESAPFTKADLKNGMIIEHRDGDRYMVIGNHLVQEEGFFRLSDYNDDLMDRDYRDYDIVKIYKPITDRVYNTSDLFATDKLDLIWERKEVKKEYKYKVGDRVRVRTDLETTCRYGDIGVINHMMSNLGKTLTISSLEETDFYGEYCPHYHVKENQWNWTDEMFEGLVEYEEMTVAEIEEKLGYKVKIVDGDSK